MASLVLITDGAGFIGSHLAQRITADGCFVRIVDDLRQSLAELIKLQGKASLSVFTGGAA